MDGRMGDVFAWANMGWETSCAMIAGLEEGAGVAGLGVLALGMHIHAWQHACMQIEACRSMPAAAW